MLGMCGQEKCIGNGYCGSPYTNDPTMKNVLVRPRITILSDSLVAETMRKFQSGGFELALPLGSLESVSRLGWGILDNRHFEKLLTHHSQW